LSEVSELSEQLVGVDELLAEGLISDVLSIIKSGKEATAYLCRGGVNLDAPYAVAKVYHERSRRNFTNDAVYQEGRVILNGQVRRAVAAKTEFGRDVQGALWVDHEFEVMSALEYAGTDVPEPYVCTENAILMAYVGDESGPAPQLQHVSLDRHEAVRLRDRLVWNIETWLGQNVVHADLSAFNILYDKGRLWAIDFPQAVDPRFSPAARGLLERDLRNVGRYFERQGAPMDVERLARSLWNRWRFGELG
jgi:RIO kinase 1